MEYIPVGIALISVIVAIYFGIKNQRLEKKNSDLQKRLLEIEEVRETDRKKTKSKGQLRALINNYGNNTYRLVVENVGNAEAKNTRLRMDEQPIEMHPASVKGDSEINSIGPNSHATRLLGLTMKCSPPFEFEASWDDESGEAGTYRTTLTF